MARAKLRVVRVAVRALDGSLIAEASVALEPLIPGAQGRIPLQFSANLGGHIARDVSPGSYVLAVSADGLESQRRQVEVTSDGLEETVVLGRPGLPYYYRGRAKVPYEPLPFIAVSFAGSSTAVDRNAKAIALRFQLEEVPVGKSVHDERVRVFRIPGDPTPERQAEILTQLSQHDGVRYAGPVVSLREDSVAFFTNEFIAKFKPSVERADAIALATNLGLTVRRAIPYAGNAFLVQSRDAWKGLVACDALRESGKVEYAEPNLVATARDDQVHPTDFLIGQQWHVPLVNLPHAWACLRQLNGPGVVIGGAGDLTFGSESITIAVFDRGIPSQTAGGVVQPLHPDFRGSVTGGASKISQYFDFVTMSPNNDNTVDDHGIKCAGLAAALANNPSGIAGENEGVVGAAPNCRVMGIIRDVGATESQYSDAYIWMAGLDPESEQEGFPEPLAPGSGADVISNSFGLEGSVGAPISGLMQNCFDYITAHGRGGKGVVLCFSTGNLPQQFQLLRPWAFYEKTIAVGASTPADTRPGFGGFGDGMDLCAPGGDGLTNLVTCHLPGGGTLTGHTGGASDYTPFFNGTSASTPLVAGIAALVLSADPGLTWSEVREILCDAADRIDYANTDAIGHWTDSDGDGVKEFSKWYGFGRVNAKAAVAAAIAGRQTSAAPPPAAPTGLRIAP